MAESIVRVAFLGPEHSFSHEATERLFPHAEHLPANSIHQAIRLAENGTVDYAVVPLENSVQGPVLDTLRALEETMLHIHACLEMEVRLVLAGWTGSRRLYSNPHALAEARNWLEENMPDTERIVTTSTSAAAARAAEEKAMCICSERAAKAHNLPIIAENVGDENNYTRFIALGWRDNPDNAARTALVAILPDQPGSLHRFLEPFARHGINLTMIYSRPARGKPWNYVFHVELEGTRLDQRVEKALREARARAYMVKILGSYPVLR